MKMFRNVLVALGLLALAPPVRVHADELAQLQEEWEVAIQKWSQVAKESVESGKVPDFSTFPAREFRPRYRRAAEVYAGRPEVIPILIWLVNSSDPQSADDEAGRDARWAIERLTRDHASDPAVKEKLSALDYAEPKTGVDLLVAFYEKAINTHKDKDVQAEAMLYLAMLHQRESIGDEDAAPPRPPNKARSTMARKLFNRLAEEYPDSPAAARAKNCLYEIQHLQVGMKAPDLVGKDVDGKEIRLSQFAGQVVVLDFWGFW